MTKELLMIFTRNPVLGKVKSRLAKQTSNETAFYIYKDLLKHTHDVTCNIDIDKWIFYSDYLEWDDIWDDAAYTKKVQSAGDLGNKMYNAFKQAFDANYTHVAVIGSDIEELNQEIIEEAFKKLKSQTVVGPAVDGGYYLLGLNKLRKDIFENKEWGGNSVLSDTLAHFKKQDVFLLPTLNDIDRLEDIKADSKLHQYIKHIKYVTK